MTDLSKEAIHVLHLVRRPIATSWGEHGSVGMDMIRDVAPDALLRLQQESMILGDGAWCTLSESGSAALDRVDSLYGRICRAREMMAHRFAARAAHVLRVAMLPVPRWRHDRIYVTSAEVPSMILGLDRTRSAAYWDGATWRSARNRCDLGAGQTYEATFDGSLSPISDEARENEVVFPLLWLALRHTMDRCSFRVRQIGVRWLADAGSLAIDRALLPVDLLVLGRIPDVGEIVTLRGRRSEVVDGIEFAQRSGSMPTPRA